MNPDILKGMSGSLALILAAQVVVFAVMVVVLRRLLLGDTLAAVQRLKSVEGDLARKEDSMRQKMEAHEQEFQAKRQAAEDELQRQRTLIEQDLAKMKERLKAEAKAEADRIVSEAQLGREKMREQLVREAAGKGVEYAGELFKLVMGRTVTQKINMAFVDDLIAGLSDVDATSVHVEADQVSFISSHRMDPAQRERLEQLVREKFDVDLKINERVDENLLAGLIIKLGSLEIDGTLANRFREAIAELKKTT